MLRVLTFASHRTLCSTVDQEEEELCEVTGEYSPGTPDVHYLPNGDPGYPGEGPEANIIEVRDDKGRVVPLEEVWNRDLDRFQEELIQKGEEELDFDFPEPEDY